MKKLLTLFCAFITLSAACMAISCNKDDKKSDDPKKGQTVKAKANHANNANLPNIRYVDADSLLAHYNLSKDYQEEMLRQQNAYENTARQRQAAIESLASGYQKQMQNNTMNEQAYNKAMQTMQQKQQAAEKELSQMQMNMQNQMITAQKIVNDSIMSFIEEYNREYGYDAIIMKSATLYINPDLDITDEVIEGLNARYNKK